MKKVRILYIVLVMSSCVAFLTACKRSQSVVQAPAPEVATLVVTAQPVVLTTELPGRTAAYRVAEVRPQVNGLVQSRLFEEGSEVKAGDARVLAHSKVIGGGETTKFDIDASKLKAGTDYAFFCSFPGHSALMKGSLKLGS